MWSSLVAAFRAYCDECWLPALDLLLRSLLLQSAIISTVLQLNALLAFTGYSDVNCYCPLRAVNDSDKYDRAICCEDPLQYMTHMLVI